MILATKKMTIFYLMVFCSIFLAYSPSVHSPYFLDDTHTVANNAPIHSLQNLFKVWTSSRMYSTLPENSPYRPMVASFNLLLWQVDGGETWPFHTFKMFLFSMLCILLFHFWRVLLPSVSITVLMAASLLFAVNPVNSQVVIYISALSSLLSITFVMLSLFLYLQFRRNGKNTNLALSGVFVFLALMTKEIGFIVILLVPLLETFIRRVWKCELKPFPLFKALLFYFFVIGLAAVVQILNFEPVTNKLRSSVDSWTYFQSQWRAYIRYISMFFWAYDLNFDNMSFGFSRKFLELKTFGALIVNLSILGFTLYTAKRRMTLWALGIFWFYLSLLPSSSLWPLAEPVNDHRAFLAGIGLSLALIFALQWLFNKNQRAFLLVSGFVFISYFAMTFHRSQIWGTPELLYLDTIKKNPKSPRAYNNLASFYINKSEYRKAEAVLENCLKHGQEYAHCFINKATVSAALGNDSEAEKYYEIATQKNQAYVLSRYFWAQFLVNRGNFTEALRLLQEADKYSGAKHFEVRLLLIKTFLSLGKNNEAVDLWNQSHSLFSGQAKFQDLGSQLGLAQ